MNLAFSLERNAWARGDQEAVKFKGKSYTYRELNRFVDAYANMLKSNGIQPGDRVSIWLPNGMEFIYSFYGILKIGALAVPMNFLFKSTETEYILKHSESSILITSREKLSELEPILGHLPSLKKVLLVDQDEEVGIFSPVSKWLQDNMKPCLALDLSPDHGACILFTSGTTGNPKGVELSHYNLQTNAEFYADSIGLTEKHYGCIVTPLSHLLVLMAGLILLVMKGGKFYLFERFKTEEVAETIRKEKINFFIGVPAMYYMLLTLPEQDRYDMSSLEICITSGAQMPLEVRRKFEERFSTFTIQAYGQTESSPVITVDTLKRERRFESVGYPLPHLEVRIVDDEGRPVPPGTPGEIIVRGHCVMKGYWRNPEATAQTIRDGWLYTGDIGKMDEDGYVYLLDRKKDVIIVGGYNVYPVEIENVLYRHPAVLEAAVIGVPDERLGEIPKAYVVLRPGIHATKEELQQFCEKHLASYKRIRDVEFLDEIPKTPTGKLMKRKLAEMK